MQLTRSLDDALDDDGLVYCRELSEANGRLFYGEEEVYVSPECRGITEYLLSDITLWNGARLRVNRVDVRLKRAPIIGIPFSQALARALLSHGRVQKSMFHVPDWTLYQGKAVVATLLGHTKERDSFIEFQGWQLLDVSDETFYVHAQIDKSLSFVSHLDGATQLHTAEERQQILSRGERVDGRQYTKHFRFDGHLPISTAKDLLNLYFPVQPLTQEFLNVIRVA
ncbi:hypothetical protein [Burkholderia cepacia]|uniref:hypothetical protein n=1 Tax=Burkholderia cepacia TaxID=292 RepID=UPI000AB3ADA8|nr:hypothetical protein [Burkholderia cepacia]